jgi:hypothetical protein
MAEDACWWLRAWPQELDLEIGKVFETKQKRHLWVLAGSSFK